MAFGAEGPINAASYQHPGGRRPHFISFTCVKGSEWGVGGNRSPSDGPIDYIYQKKAASLWTLVIEKFGAPMARIG